MINNSYKNTLFAVLDLMISNTTSVRIDKKEATEIVLHELSKEITVRYGYQLFSRDAMRIAIEHLENEKPVDAKQFIKTLIKKDI